MIDIGNFRELLAVSVVYIYEGIRKNVTFILGGVLYSRRTLLTIN